jgi:hypothetical protein
MRSSFWDQVKVFEEWSTGLHSNNFPYRLFASEKEALHHFYQREVKRCKDEIAQIEVKLGIRKSDFEYLQKRLKETENDD